MASKFDPELFFPLLRFVVSVEKPLPLLRVSISLVELLFVTYSLSIYRLPTRGGKTIGNASQSTRRIKPAMEKAWQILYGVLDRERGLNRRKWYLLWQDLYSISSARSIFRAFSDISEVNFVLLLVSAGLLRVENRSGGKLIFASDGFERFKNSHSNCALHLGSLRVEGQRAYYVIRTPKGERFETIRDYHLLEAVSFNPKPVPDSLLTQALTGSFTLPPQMMELLSNERTETETETESESVILSINEITPLAPGKDRVGEISPDGKNAAKTFDFRGTVIEEDQMKALEATDTPQSEQARIENFIDTSLKLDFEARVDVPTQNLSQNVDEERKSLLQRVGLVMGNEMVEDDKVAVIEPEPEVKEYRPSPVGDERLIEICDDKISNHLMRSTIVTLALSLGWKDNLSRDGTIGRRNARIVTAACCPASYEFSFRKPCKGTRFWFWHKQFMLAQNGVVPLCRLHWKRGYGTKERSLLCKNQ